jgi:hypothetical protein
MSDELDIRSVIEVCQIKNILQPYPELLKVFLTMCKCCNAKIRDEKTCLDLPLEPIEEPELSDHSSDEDDGEWRGMSLS